jgi:hypothetical protein
LSFSSIIYLSTITVKPLSGTSTAILFYPDRKREKGRFNGLYKHIALLIHNSFISTSFYAISNARRTTKSVPFEDRTWELSHPMRASYQWTKSSQFGGWSIVLAKMLEFCILTKTYGGNKVTCVYFYLSRVHEILCRGHELLSRGDEIAKSWPRDTMSWPRVTKSWRRDS